MSEILCPKCSRPWCDHVGDGHDEPICPTKPEHRCPSCECADLRASNAALRGALRHAARELQYVLDADPCEQAEIHQSGEALACVALAESLLGPMREWPEEPNASALARAAEASPSASDGGGGER